MTTDTTAASTQRDPADYEMDHLIATGRILEEITGDLIDKLATARCNADRLAHQANRACASGEAAVGQLRTALADEHAKLTDAEEAHADAHKLLNSEITKRAKYSSELASIRATITSYQAAAVAIADALADDGGLGPVDDDQASRDAAFLRFAEGLARRAAKVRARDEDRIARLRSRVSEIEGLPLLAITHATAAAIAAAADPSPPMPALASDAP